MENIRLRSLYTFVLRLPLYRFCIGNFTNFDMLFLAVVKDFDFFAKMKIQFKRGMVHFAAVCSKHISQYSMLLSCFGT